MSRDANSSERRQAVVGRLCVLGAASLWGLTATLARHVFRDHHVPALTVVELRLGIATLLLGVFLVLRKPEALRMRREDIGYFLILGLFGVAAVQGSYYYAISRIGVGMAILLQYLAPSLIVALEVLRGRRIGMALAAAVVLAVTGTGLLVGGADFRSFSREPMGWAVGFASAGIFAFYIVYSKRGLGRYSPESVLFYTFGIAAAFWAVLTPPWAIAAQHYAADVWAMFLALGVFSTLVPFALFYAGLRRLPSTETGVIATFEPVVAVLASALFLDEALRPLQWVGAGLVMAASALASTQNPQAVAATAERG